MRRSRHIFLLCLLAIGVLGSCASSPPASTESVAPTPPITPTQSKKTLSLYYSGNRYLEAEPCDCAIKKLGGLDREANVLTKWRNAAIGESFFFAGGTQLAPEPKLYKPGDIRVQAARAEYLIEAFNILGLTALSPTAEDLSLPLEEIRKLQKKAVFPFLSTNLYSKSTQKPLFNPFLELQHDGIKVVVFGVSDIAHERFETDNDLLVLDAEIALAPHLANLPKDEPTLIILLSSLSTKKRMALQKKFPQIHLVLGANHKVSPNFAVKQEGKHTLFLHPTGLGRALSQIELEMKTPITAFYNTWIATQTKDRRRIWGERLKETQEKLKTPNLGKEDRADYKLKEQEFLSFLERTKDIPLSANPSYIRYSSNIVEVDSSFDLPQNDLTQLLVRYNEGIKKAKLAPPIKKDVPSIPIEAHGPPVEDKPVKSEPRQYRGGPEYDPLLD